MSVNTCSDGLRVRPMSPGILLLSLNNVILTSFHLPEVNTNHICMFYHHIKGLRKQHLQFPKQENIMSASQFLGVIIQTTRNCCFCPKEDRDNSRLKNNVTKSMNPFYSTVRSTHQANLLICHLCLCVGALHTINMRRPRLAQTKDAIHDITTQTCLHLYYHKDTTKH